VVYERGSEVGGNWLYSETPGSHSSVYETTFAISSKRLSQFDDFPMPAHYPDYPSHAQILGYIQEYARHFGVPHIRFNTAVSRAELLPDSRWRIHLEDGDSDEFDYLIVANGHHSVPRMPAFQGNFNGTIIHSHDYKRAAPFAGKRVLVIGGGNSACDIAVETSRVSKSTAISLRRGYYVWPKFILGQPTDVFNSIERWLPMSVNSVLARAINYLCVGSYRSYGLDSPKHGPYQQHPILNSELLYYIRHGRIQPRRAVDHFEGAKGAFPGRLMRATTVSSPAPASRSAIPFSTQAWQTTPRVTCRCICGSSTLSAGACCSWPHSTPGLPLDAGDWSRLVSEYILGSFELPANLEKLVADDLLSIRRNY
jgi:cation diffusion facilitator CzcD-associated flavoprotein CzcO